MPTSWSTRAEGFVLLLPHDHSPEVEEPWGGYHEWIPAAGLTPPRIKPYVYLDFLGRRTDRGGWRWDTFQCNNGDCTALAQVRSTVVVRELTLRFPSYLDAPFVEPL